MNTLSHESPSKLEFNAPVPNFEALTSKGTLTDILQ